MIHIKDADPENAVNLASYKETLGQLLGEWHENDTDAVAAAMADYMTGPLDMHATSKLVRAILSRAESIIERSKG